MEKRLILISSLLIFTILINGCSSLNHVPKVKLINEESSPLLETGIRQSIGRDNGRAITNLGVSSVVDNYTGIIIGRKMDRIASQVALIEGASVDSIKDASNLKAVKITFDSGVLFPIGKSTLNPKSIPGLKNLAEILVSNQTIDIAIMGHTDNQGLFVVNQELSQNRAQAVADFLQQNNVSIAQFKVVIGKNSSEPLRDNNTTIGRAVNRRVEVYMYASKQMIQESQQLAK
jgi:outer membrane protein OmpA-like peptidoglycan-associated protein